MITVISSVQVSGVRFQQNNSALCIGVAHEMIFLSPMLVFSGNKSVLRIRYLLTPET